MMRRTAVLVIVAFMVMLALPAVASAHIVVSPSAVAKGATDVSLAFRVPNESDTADTVKVEVKFPTDHPVANVLVEPVAGWKVQVQKAKLARPIQTDDGSVTEAVSLITWQGGATPPGEFQDFVVAVGLLPSDTDALSFPTVQTYSDGSTAEWTEPTVAGAPEPEHPAPVLTLTGAGTSTTSGTTTAGGAAATAAAPTVTAARSAGEESGSSSDTATVALVVAAVAAVLAGAALVLARRRAGGGPPSSAPEA